MEWFSDWLCVCIEMTAGSVFDVQRALPSQQEVERHAVFVERVCVCVCVMTLRQVETLEQCSYKIYSHCVVWGGHLSVSSSSGLMAATGESALPAVHLAMRYLYFTWVLLLEYYLSYFTKTHFMWRVKSLFYMKSGWQGQMHSNLKKHTQIDKIQAN